MAKKAMASFLLVVILAWAEMTMAPMFAMHAGHMRSGHEMAVDMPAEHAAHHHAKQHPAVAEGRPCCPGLHKAQPEALLEMVSDSPACDDPHSCCFRQGPQSVPAPARDVQRLNRQVAPAEAANVNPVLPTAMRAVHHSAPTLSPPPDVFGMTLRV
jgi:hypothetical protein